MSMNLTDNFNRLGRYWEAFFEDHKKDTTPKIEDVWYGDQNLLPHTPAICVETGNLARQFAGVPYRVENNFEVYIMVYHGEITDKQINRDICEKLAVQIQDLMHSDIRCDNPLYDPAVSTAAGLVIYGMVSAIEPGYTVRQRSLMYTTRITWFGMSKTSIT